MDSTLSEVFQLDDIIRGRDFINKFRISTPTTVSNYLKTILTEEEEES